MTTTTKPRETSLKCYLEALLDGRDLTTEEVEEAFSRILAGADAPQVSALLVLLRFKGETAQEIAGMVQAMQKACTPVKVEGRLLDIVGTGGDGAHTINISTAAIVVAAACGCRAAKLGNRSVSSLCGSADVLEALGIKVDMSAQEVERCIETTNIGFMFAPTLHPAMKVVAPVRKSMGVRTAFNIVGPLLNPARAQCVVVGVFHERLLELIANALMEMGQIEAAIVVHGAGLDEISPLGPSRIVEIRNVNSDPQGPKRYERSDYEVDPKDCGVERCRIEDLKGGDARENASLLREVLRGGDHRDAKRDAVALNAGAGLYVYGVVGSLAEGVKVAYSAITSGKAIEKLDEWIAFSSSLGATA